MTNRKHVLEVKKRFAYPAPQKPTCKGHKYLIYPF